MTLHHTCSKCTSEVTFENLDHCNPSCAAAAGIADGFKKFSKSGLILILLTLYSKGTGEVSFENFNRCNQDLPQLLEPLMYSQISQNLTLH